MTQDKQLEAGEVLDKWRNKWEEIPKHLRVSYPYNWYIINAMEEYAAQFQLENKQVGAVWVKASQRLPELDWKGVMDIDGLYHNSDGAKIKWYFQTYPNCVIYWLDEHPQQPTLEAISAMAEKVAEEEYGLEPYQKKRFIKGAKAILSALGYSAGDKKGGIEMSIAPICNCGHSAYYCNGNEHCSNKSTMQYLNYEYNLKKAQQLLENMILPTVLPNFKRMRKKSGYTLREVEEQTKISNPYLSQLETGKVKNPSYHVVSTLVNFYNQNPKPPIK